jgi:hypothetical protein
MAGNPTIDGGTRPTSGGVVTLTPIMTTNPTAVVIIASFSKIMVGRLGKIGNIGSRICRVIRPARMNDLGNQVLDGKRVESNGTIAIAIAITGTRIKARKIRTKIVIGWRRRKTVIGRESTDTTMTTTT